MTRIDWTIILVIVCAMIAAGIINWAVRGDQSPTPAVEDANNTVNAIDEVRNPNDTNDLFEPEQ